jgi:hypothetical protein
MKPIIRLGLGLSLGRSLYQGLCFLTGLWVCSVVLALLVHQWLVAVLLAVTGWKLNRLFWRWVG